MARIAGLFCVLCGFISSVHGDAVNTTEQTKCEGSSTVQNLTLLSVGSTSIALHWDAPEMVCGNLYDYEVRYWQASRDSHSTTYIPASFQIATIGNLEPNTVYTFIVIAISRDPKGTVLNGSSAIVNATTDPGPVTDLTVSQQNARSVKLSWKAPENSATFEVCVYVLRPNWSSCQFTTDMEYTIMGLKPETAYSIKVTAVRMNTGSTVAARGTAQTGGASTICERSLTVRALYQSGVSSTSVTLRWEAPERVCGILEGYEVRYWQIERASRGTTNFQTRNQTATIGILEPNTAYTFSVGAISREPSGTVLNGDSAIFNTLTDPGPVTDLKVSQQNARSVKFNWKAPENSKTFEVCAYATSSDWLSCRLISDNVEYTFMGLYPETAYSITVTAVRMNERNTVAARGTEETTRATTICESSATVQALNQSGVTSTTVTLRWKAPERVCGIPAGYEVRYWQVERGSLGATNVQTAYPAETVYNLEPNTAYAFSVGAISREPSGTVLTGTSAIVTTTTDPGPVTDLTVSQQNARSVKFNWKAPKNSKTFEVCVLALRRNWSSCQFTTDVEYTMMGLQPETAYSIKVTAVRMNERNTVAARGNAQTGGARTICEISAPLKLQPQLFAGGSSYIVLAWMAPSNVCGKIVNIVVSFFERTASSKGKSTVERIIYDASTTRANMTALAAYTVHNFTVYAQTLEPSGRDTSGASDSVELRTAPARVNHLEKMRVTSDSFEARWSAPHSGQDHQLLYYLKLYSLSLSSTRKLTNTTSITTVKFEKLESASAYRLEITASCMLTSVTRIYSDTASIDIKTDCSSPSVPQLTVDAPTSNMDMRVSWQHNASGCLNISYVIFMTFLNRTSHVENSSREFVFRNLQPYTNYSVVVSAVRTDGLNRRAYSNSSTVIVSTPAAAPLGLTLRSPKNIDSSSAIVVWERPTSWNGQPGGYIIALVTDNGTLSTFHSKNATDTEHNFVHLQPSTYYEVQLIAFNNLVNSSVEILNFTTPQRPGVSASTSIEIEIMLPAIIAVVLIAAVAVLIGLWLNRRRSTPEKASAQELSPLTRLKTDGREATSDKAQRRAKHSPKLLILEETTCGVPQDDVYGNAAAVGISLAAFPTFVRSELSESTPFAAEFKALKSSIASLQTAGQKPSNKTKNKFKDIIPYDESRVVLTPKSADTDTDYINASFIEGYGGKPRRYIAAQGPTNDTIEDFWRMALEYRSEVIVMVTRLFEAGVTKCAWYWPESGTKVHGSIEVTLLSSDEFPDYQINVLEVVRKSDGSRLTVKHFYYTSWPDHGVPDYALSMLKFRRNVIAFTGSTDSPTIVHCSAGVGRTGTYIAIDYLLNEARGSGRVNVRLCVERMREQRPKMVQTREQYAFIYQAVMEATQAGDTSIACEQFCSYYKKLTENSNELLRKEHEIFVKAIQPLTRESCSAALLPENSKKNVSPEILPANQRRPILLTRSSSADETDYINAVFLNTSKKKDGFVVTQTPLPHTKSDFWRMVLDYRVGTIIALDSVTNKKSSEKYWPEMGQDFQLGDALRVSCVRGSPDSSGFVRTRDFRVNRANASDGFAVRQFEFLNWPSSDPCPKDESSLMELISSIDRWTAQAEAGTILVHCSNGANKSGLLVAAMNALRCAEAEQVVDVYMTGLLLRQHRPQFLCNVEQYHYLYKIMASYVETFDTYSNFLPSCA